MHASVAQRIKQPLPFLMDIGGGPGWSRDDFLDSSDIGKPIEATSRRFITQPSRSRAHT